MTIQNPLGLVLDNTNPMRMIAQFGENCEIVPTHKQLTV